MSDATKDIIVIIHISDLHIGRVLHNNTFPYLFSGYAAHDFILCTAMPPALEDVRDLTGLPDEAPLRFVVSGDITATGDLREYAVAELILDDLAGMGGGPRTPPSVLASSRRYRPPTNLASVPGNHDQWDGHTLWMWGYNPNLAGVRFEPCGWRGGWASGDLEVELWGLDSNAGFPPMPPPPPGYSNWCALGALDLSPTGQIARSREDLTASDLAGPQGEAKVRVRAFCVHHSPSYVPSPMWPVLYLLDDSKAALLSLAEDYRVVAFLTGHTHDFGPGAPLSTAQSWKVWELRSASTFQGPATRRKPSPGFLVHKIWLDDHRRPHWHTWAYSWAFPRFAPASRLTPNWQVLP
jgi:3',5'-cyclic AMP phosphodiesterase CpdA